MARRVGTASGETIDMRAEDGVALKASWFPAPAAFPACVLILHGVADSRASSAGFAPLFLESGYAVLAPDSRAHGESGGSLVTYGLLEKHDVILWTEWMRSKGCSKLYGLGESLGGSILIQAAAVKPAFTALIAESAFADLRQVAKHRAARMAPWLGVLAQPAAAVVVGSGRVVARVEYGVDLGAVAPVRDIAALKIPMLLIHGLDDDQTPP
ncbi:MAG: alpha/beta fold hydrolase [Acidobacteriota bacterium]